MPCSGAEGEGYLHSYVAREIAGRVVVLTRWEADGSSEDPQSLAAVYVGGRRWDVVLANGVQIRLPEHGAREALANLVEIDRREALFDRDIASIDVRLSDRIAIRPTEAALAVDAKAGSARKVRREARI